MPPSTSGKWLLINTGTRSTNMLVITIIWALIPFTSDLAAESDIVMLVIFDRYYAKYCMGIQ